MRDHGGRSGVALQLPLTAVHHTDMASAAPVRGQWLGAYTLDPITGLVAFPSFLSAFKRLFGELLRTFDGMGLAIGDVDDLKSYVESVNHRDPMMFGHLAGNAFMSKLGIISLETFERIVFPWRCLATFGGDEIIVACAGCSRPDFVSSVHLLCTELAARLPRTVSFAHGWFSVPPEQREERMDDEYAASLSLSVIATVDRALFRCKGRRHKHRLSAPPSIAKMKQRLLTNPRGTSTGCPRQSLILEPRPLA